MNILFFLSPKQDLMYVYDDFTLRQTLEKWENNRYASIPVLNRKGEYVGTLTEGDILWGLKKFHGLDLEAAEDIPIRDFAHKRDYKAVTVTTSMDQLIEAAMNQNFVPVVDDRGMFIGIVRRQADHRGVFPIDHGEVDILQFFYSAQMAFEMADAAATHHIADGQNIVEHGVPPLLFFSV